MTEEFNAWNLPQHEDNEILDSASEPSHYEDGTPVAVTVPIILAPGVRVYYATRLGGVSQGPWATLNLGGYTGDSAEHVYANRVSFAQSIHAPLSLVTQVHGATVADADAIEATGVAYGFDGSDVVLPDGTTTARIEADGQVSARSGIALGMFAADCLPLFLADPVNGIIGAAHCGRKGLVGGVIEATVAAMEAKGAQRGNIVATLGPSICGECYEVGDAIADSFEQRFPLTSTKTRFGGTGIDLAEAVRIDLAFAGVTKEVSSVPRVHAATEYLNEDEELTQICLQDNLGPEDLIERWNGVKHSLCTLENPLWHSHRRAARAGVNQEGRMLAVIVRD